MAMAVAGTAFSGLPCADLLLSARSRSEALSGDPRAAFAKKLLEGSALNRCTACRGHTWGSKRDQPTPQQERGGPTTQVTPDSRSAPRVCSLRLPDPHASVSGHVGGMHANAGATATMSVRRALSAHREFYSGHGAEAPHPSRVPCLPVVFFTCSARSTHSGMSRARGGSKSKGGHGRPRGGCGRSKAKADEDSSLPSLSNVLPSPSLPCAVLPVPGTRGCAGTQSSSPTRLRPAGTHTYPPPAQPSAPALRPPTPPCLLRRHGTTRR